MSTTSPLSATLGFDEVGRPAEIFLSGAKDGSGLAAILEDASVVISVGLQHSVLDGPASKPASPIGAALDLLVQYEAAQNG